MPFLQNISLRCAQFWARKKTKILKLYALYNQLKSFKVYDSLIVCFYSAKESDLRATTCETFGLFFRFLDSLLRFFSYDNTKALKDSFLSTFGRIFSKSLQTLLINIFKIPQKLPKFSLLPVLLSISSRKCVVNLCYVAVRVLQEGSAICIFYNACEDFGERSLKSSNI